MTASTFGDPAAPAPPRRRPAAGEFVRYFAASAAALLCDTALYSALLVAGAGWPAAATAGFCLGLLVAYGLSVRLVFAHRALARRTHEFVVFAAVGLVGLLLTHALLWLQIERLQVAAPLAKLGAAACVFLSNFGLRKALLFTRRDARHDGER